MEDAFRAVNDYLHEDIVIVTGAVYGDEETTREKDGLEIGVPTVMYKALYSPSNKAGIAAIAQNTQDANVELVSLAQLKKRIGRDVFASGLVQDETSVSWRDMAQFLSNYLKLDHEYGRLLHRVSMKAE